APTRRLRARRPAVAGITRGTGAGATEPRRARHLRDLRRAQGSPTDRAGQLAAEPVSLRLRQPAAAPSVAEAHRRLRRATDPNSADARAVRRAGRDGCADLG